MKTNTFAIALTLVSSAALGMGQASLESARGDKITIEFDTEVISPNHGGGTSYIAKDLQVTVTGGRMVGPAQVVIASYCGLPGTEFNLCDTTVVNLVESEDGIFVSETAEVTVRASSYRYPGLRYQTVSIVDNGHWLVDPVNGTNDFQTDLFLGTDWN